MMAKLCDLLKVKYGILFGDPEVRQLQSDSADYIKNVSGIDVRTRIQHEQIIALTSLIRNQNPKWRIAGLEYHNPDNEMVALAWELFRDEYDHSWLNEAAEKIPKGVDVILYFIDEGRG
jgi:hypothetical protein